MNRVSRRCTLLAEVGIACALLTAPLSARAQKETVSLSEYQQLVRDYQKIASAAKPDKTRARDLARKLRPIKTVQLTDNKTVSVDLSPDADALTVTEEVPKNKKPFQTAARRASALQTLVIPDGDAPDAANAKAQASAILARTEFQVEPEKETTPGWLKSIGNWFRRELRAFGKWLDKWLGGLFPSPNVSPGALTGVAYFMRFLLFFLVAVGTLIGLYFLVTYLMGKKRGQTKRGKTKGTTGLDLDEDAFPDPLGYARELAARGDYREAVRLAYIASLRRLAGSGLLTLQENRTNWEYQRTLRSRSQAAYDTLLPGTRLFDRIWYGRQNATRAEYEQAVALHDALPAPLLSSVAPGEKPLAGAGSGKGANSW